jgi:ribosomal protein L11 methyltransferase
VPYRIDFHQPDAGSLDRVIDLGALDAECRADGQATALMPDSVTPEQVAEAVGVLAVSVSPAIGRDGESVWMLSRRPTRIGRVRLVPHELTDIDPEPGDVRLIDTPAFGTGLHPTTALCLEVLDDLVDASWPASMLDVGTGSGVLALAALRLGVPRATAIDIDEEAVRATVQNGRINGLAERLDVRHAAAHELSGQWPLVVANVLAAPLIEMAPTLVRRIGHAGRLILSGVPTALRGEVERAYRDRGLHLVEVRTRAGWVALVLQALW